MRYNFQMLTSIGELTKMFSLVPCWFYNILNIYISRHINELLAYFQAYLNIYKDYLDSMFEHRCVLAMYIYNCHLPYRKYSTKTLYSMNKTNVPVITVGKFKVFKVISCKEKEI